MRLDFLAFISNKKVSLPTAKKYERDFILLKKVFHSEFAWVLFCLLHSFTLNAPLRGLREWLPSRCVALLAKYVYFLSPNFLLQRLFKNTTLYPLLLGTHEKLVFSVLFSFDCAVSAPECRGVSFYFHLFLVFFLQLQHFCKWIKWNIWSSKKDFVVSALKKLNYYLIRKLI